MNKVRLRFAPSPTGFLHIGGLRTALFAYVIAKSLDGELVLRIEDTDRAREVEGATEELIKVLTWAGIEFNEGPQKPGKFGPYIQSQRQDVYNKYIQELLDQKKAYYCFCTAERLTEMRESQQAKKQAPRYDRCCRDLRAEEVQAKLDKSEDFVIRQKMPLDGEVIAIDELRGEIKFRAQDLDDHVLMKSDGFPTYQFASVVDDHLMEISHVTRGEEWIPSFPKNSLLYEAFGWEKPKFIHLPLILNKEGGKLSKRQNDVAVEDYQAQGYLPAALINFSVLLGWHPKDDQEVLTIDEVISKFRVEDMQISPAIFDRDKLDYFNGQYLRKLSVDKLLELARPYLKDTVGKDDEYIKKAIGLEQARIKKLDEIPEMASFFFVDKLDYDKELLFWKKLDNNQIKDNLVVLAKELKNISTWEEKALEEKIITWIKDNDNKVGDFLWPMRVSLTGKKASPGPFEVASVLGKEESLNRIKQAIELL